MMIPTYSEQELNGASNPELAMMWNGLLDKANEAKLEHKNKPVSRFPSKSAAIQRLTKFQNDLIAQMNGEKPTESTPAASKAAKPKKTTLPGEITDETRKKMSEATKATWLREEVRAARKQRHYVKVEGVCYQSVAKACEALRLPMGGHIKFRGKLKAEGTGEYQGKTFQVIPHEEFLAYHEKAK